MPLNQRVSAPFGDITFFNPSRTDRFVAQHQLEERQDELQRQREIDDADKQLASHIGNVLNPDIPDIVSGWQEYKNAKKQLLFDQKLQRDPSLYAQKQMEVNTKLANVLNSIGSSTQRKQSLYQQLQGARLHPEKFEDNAAQRIIMGMNTPSGYAMQNPDFDNHMWQGPDEDFTKAFNEAKGKERVLQTVKTPMGKNGEQLAVNNISGFNDPSVYMNTLNAKNSDRRHSMQAAKVLDNMTPEEIDRINRDYAAMSKERFSNWNMKEAPNLEPADPSNKAQVLHSLQAKAYALTSQFTSKEGKPEINTEVRRKLNDASKLNLQAAGIRQRLAASKELAAFKKSIGVGSGSGSGDDDYNDPIEPILNRLDTQAKEGGTAIYKTADGQKFNTYIVKAPVELKKAMEVKEGVKVKQPDEIRTTDNGDYIGIFYEKKPDGTNVENNGMTAVSKVIPPIRLSREDVKNSLGKQFLTKKSNEKILTAKPKATKDLSADEILKKYGITQ